MVRIAAAKPCAGPGRGSVYLKRATDCLGSGQAPRSAAVGAQLHHVLSWDLVFEAFSMGWVFTGVGRNRCHPEAIGEHSGALDRAAAVTAAILGCCSIPGHTRPTGTQNQNISPRKQNISGGARKPHAVVNTHWVQSGDLGNPASFGGVGLINISFFFIRALACPYPVQQSQVAQCTDCHCPPNIVMHAHHNPHVRRNHRILFVTIRITHYSLPSHDQAGWVDGRFDSLRP